MGRKKLNRSYKSLHVKFLPRDHEALEYYCQERGITMSELIRELTDPFIKEGKSLMEQSSSEGES